MNLAAAAPAAPQTGTLTMNKLTVENVWVDGLVLAARSVSGFIGQQLTASPEQHAAGTGPLATRQWEELAPLTRLMVAATACNTAVFGGGDAEEEKPEGEAAAEPQHGAASGGAAAAAGSSRGGGGGDGASSASHVVVSVPEDSAADATTPKRDGSQRPAAPRSSASFSGRGGGGGTTAADSPASPGAGGGSVRRTASYLQLLESAVPRRVLSFLVAHGLAANKPRSAGARQARGNPLDCALLTFADSLFPAEALRDSLGQASSARRRRRRAPGSIPPCRRRRSCVLTPSPSHSPATRGRCSLCPSTARTSGRASSSRARAATPPARSPW